MNERDEKRRQAYLHGYVDGKGGRSYARDYAKVIADTMDAVERAYHTGYTAGEYARQAEKEGDDDEMPQLPEHSDSSYPIRALIGKQFWINLLLTILGYIPGIVHAVWVIARY